MDDQIIVMSRVSDGELESAFWNTNFGLDLSSPQYLGNLRKLVVVGVLKCLVHYHNGHTLETILKKLGLVGKTAKVTKKGRNFIRDECSHLFVR